MKEAKDFTPIEWVIYNFNHALMWLASGIFLYYGFSYVLFVMLGGYVIYVMMRFSRGSIYKLGISRFYLYGCLIYLSIFLSMFINIDTTNYLAVVDFLGMIKTLNFMYADQLLSTILFNFFQIFHFKNIVWSFVYGVFIYVMVFEFGRKKVRDADLAGLHINESVFWKFNENYYYAFLFFVGLTFLYMNWLLLAIFMICETIIKNTPKYIGGIVLGWWILIGLYCLHRFTFKVFVLDTMVFQSLVYGIGAFVHYYFAATKPFIIGGGLALLLPYAFIRMLVLLKSSKKFMSKFEEVNRQNVLAQQSRIGDFEIGIDTKTRKTVMLTHKECNQHVMVCGTIGAGKTTALLLWVIEAAKKKMPLLFMDGKGDLKLIGRFAKICEQYNVPLKVFCMRPENVPDEYKKHLAVYNPFSSGTFTEWKNRLMSLFAEAEGRGQQHYAIAEESLLNFVVQILHSRVKTVDLNIIAEFLSNPSMLISISEKDQQESVKARLDDVNLELVSDMAKILNLFINSSYGELFDTTSNSNVISLPNMLKNNEIVLFIFDSSTYKSDTEKIAKMVINDINSSFAELREPVNAYCVFDEFASYASGNLADTISLHRSNGMHAVIGTQSVTTVGLKSPETARIAKELLASCNTYVAMWMNLSEDIETFAEQLGSAQTFEQTTQSDATVGGATGMGSTKMVNEFQVHPQAMRDLRTGEAYIYRKAYGLKPYKIKFNNSGF